MTIGDDSRPSLMCSGRCFRDFGCKIGRGTRMSIDFDDVDGTRSYSTGSNSSEISDATK